MSTYLQSALKKKKEKLINASEARRPTAQVSFEIPSSLLKYPAAVHVFQGCVRIMLLMHIPWFAAWTN
jgi:hypothetical protein